MDKTIDIPYEDALDITKDEIVQVYECTEEEAEEAMTYISYYLEDYDPKDKEEYHKELSAFMEKLESYKDAENVGSERKE
jgi:hypothetical protein